MTTEDLWLRMEPYLTKIEPLTEEVAGLKEDMTEVKSEVKTLKEDMVEVKSEVKTLKEDMVEVKGKVETLTEDMVEVKGKVETLTEDMVEIKGKVETLTEDMTEVKGKVETLTEDVTAIKSKLNIAVDINMAQILEQQVKNAEEQRRMFKEMNQTITKYMYKNEIDHKKFEYEIEKLKYGDMGSAIMV